RPSRTTCRRSCRSWRLRAGRRPPRTSHDTAAPPESTPDRTEARGSRRRGVHRPMRAKARPSMLGASKGGVMRRRTFDWLVSSGGAVLTVFLIVAGVLLFAGYKFADNNVHSQRASEKIFFPPNGSESITSLPATDRPFIQKHAGQQLVNGAQAEAYADHFIAVHLKEIGGGQ